MIYKSGLITQASGSLNGITFSHNRGGQYVRARVIPVNPGSPQQSTLRTIFMQLVGLWGSILTAAEKASWDNYSQNVTFPNALGDPKHIGAMQNYVRSNIGRLQTGLIRVDTAPAIFDIGEFTPPTLESVTAPSALSIGFQTADAWVNEDDSGMMVYASRPQNVNINFFKGPYRFAGLIPGDLALPPTSPAAITSGFTYVAGQKVFVAGRVSRADGRLSSMFRLEGIVV